MEKENATQIRVLTSIPPMVPGDVRGTLHIKFPLLKWDCTTPPPAPRLSILLKWWGENTDGCVFKVPIEYKQKLHPSIKPSTAQYDIVSNWKQFHSYLQDMGHMTLILGLGRSANDMLVIGECTVPHLASISPDKIEKRNCTVVTSDKSVHLGRLVIEIIAKMKSKPKKLSIKPLTVKKTTNNPSQNIQTPSNFGGHSLVHKPVHLVTVPVNNKNWKSVGQVKLDSVTTSDRITSHDQSAQVPLSNVAKLMVAGLIERAKTLHGDMISAINDGIHDDTVKVPTTITMERTANDGTFEHSVGVVDVTPPISPSDSMLEAATLMCIDGVGNNVLEDVSFTNNESQYNQPLIETECRSIPIRNRNQTGADKNRIESENRAMTVPPENRAVTVLAPYHNRLLSLPTVNHSSRDPELFHILLELSKGSGIYKSSDPATLPSVCVQCRLFCLSVPINSKIFPGTREPNINMKQIIPVCMRWNELLEYLERGYAIIEVWDSCNDTQHNEDRSIRDELIGLVKISLYPFYAAIWSSLQTPSHKESLFPVVAVDSSCPITDPFTGNVNGHLNIKLMMGTPADIPAKIITIIPSCADNIDNDNIIVTPLESSQDSSNGFAHEQHTIIEEDDDKMADRRTEHDTDDQKEASPFKHPNRIILPVDDKIEIDLLISQALHLPLLSTPLGGSHCIPPSVYVTCHPHPSVSKVSTSVCNDTTKPQWDHHCTVHIPRMFLDATLCELEFQVWSLPPPIDSNQIYSADPKSHIFLGRAFVDLVPLQYGLRSIVGWYNVMDLAGDLHGQLKIAITPRSIIPLRTDGKTINNFYQSGSLLPVEIELCSTNNNRVTVTTSGNSWCDKTIIDQYKHDEHTQTLSMLRQQLQSHVTDLEVIQDSLEAKLRDQSTPSSITTPSLRPMVTSPSLQTEQVLVSIPQPTPSSNTTPSLRPMVTSPSLQTEQKVLVSIPQPTPSSNTTPSLRPIITSTTPSLRPIVTSTTPSLRPIVTSPASQTEQQVLVSQDSPNMRSPNHSDGGPDGEVRPLFGIPSPVFSHDTRNTSTPLLPTETNIANTSSPNKTLLNSSLVHSMPNIMSDDSECLKQATVNEHVVESIQNETMTNEYSSENEQDNSADYSVTLELLNDSKEDLINNSNDRGRAESDENVINQQDGGNDDEKSKEMVTNARERVMNDDIVTTDGGSTRQQSLLMATTEHDVNLGEGRYPGLETHEDSDEDMLTNVTSETTTIASLSSSELGRRIETLVNQSDERGSVTSEDTSVLVDTTDPVEHEDAPVISDDDDDDKSEEQEVKRLFNRLLKERRLSDLSNDPLSSNDESEQTQEQLSESEASTQHDGFSDNDSFSDNESLVVDVLNENKKTVKLSRPVSHIVGQYSHLPKTQLANRLLDMRCSALGQRPPRPVQSSDNSNNSEKDLFSMNHKRKRVNIPRIRTPERERLARIFNS